MKLQVSFNKKKALIAAVLVLLIGVGSVLVPDVPIHFTLAACALLAMAAFLRLEVRGWSAVTVMTVFSWAASAATVLLCQAVNELRGSPRSAWMILLGCMCFLFAAVVLQTLLLCVSRISIRPVVILVSAVLLTLAVANRFTYEYRGSALTPSDLLGARTAFNILGSYRIYVEKNIWYAIVFVVTEIVLASSIRTESWPRIPARRLVALAATLVLGAVVHTSLGKITPEYMKNNGCIAYGFVVNFSRQLRDSFVVRPEGYKGARIRELELQYDADGTELPETLPHVIVIMNESLADFRVFGELNTSEPVTPFLDSLQENTIRGFVLSSAYGGRTPNSEFELLTGNSMAFFNPSTIAFSLIQRPCYSLERYLESLGYESYATHPEDETNWRRQQVYPLLGFSRACFREGYPDAPRINDWALDEAVYDNLIREYESSKTGAPRFLFAVTSQNHGPYLADPEETGHDEGFPLLPISGYDSDSVAAYLARIHESDRAFQKLVEYFAQVDEPVVILMYGDHHPNEETEMIRYLHGGDLESLDEQQLMYEVPFFIWANFYIEKQRPGLSSINYLSNELLEAAGLPLPPYNRFLKDIRQTVPAMNVFGYYSLSEGRFLPLAEASGAEKQALQDYEILQYNALFDKKNRSGFFFPAGEASR